MEHGVSWITLLPGYQQLEAWLRQQQAQGIMGHPPVLQHMLSALLVALICMAMALWVRRDLRRAGEGAIIPEAGISLRNCLEMALEAMYTQSREIIGPDCGRYFPVLGTFALFILVSNCLGLIPGFTPPTDNWNTTFACGIFIFFYYNYHGLRAHGMGHLAHLANPVGTWWGWFLAPLMLPLELVSHLARPFSLGVRLATNMVADHAVLVGFLGLVPILVPVPFLVLGLMVAMVQTFVFVLLSMIYIGMATSGGHDEHPDEAHA